MKFIPSLHTYTRLIEEGYTTIPIVLRVEMPKVDALLLFEQLYKGEKRFIFESGGKGRYTMMGGNPSAEWRNDFAQFRSDMKRYHSPVIEELPKCVGGAFGYLSYDFAWQLEELPEMATKDLRYDDFYFMKCDDPIVIDEREQLLYLVQHIHVDETTYNSEMLYEVNKDILLNRYEQIMQIVNESKDHQSQDKNVENLLHEFRHAELTKERIAAFEKEQFMDAVIKIQEYIRSGDVFQVNLSVRQRAQLSAKPIEVYRLLRMLNPSPYMGYMELPEYQLVSCSPELLIKVENGMIETRPIAGTRPRTGNEKEDRRKAEELINNEKERAEHIMLVDLERNDLGRVCEYGTVEVSEYMVVENYSHVMHIVSHVRGKLADKEDAFTAIQACFPGGTITGAPKIRTMEIIEECEPVKRGPYTGSMGWIDFNGNMELNILIRTMFVQDEMGYIQAGAGIVIDSIPEQEYKESLRKAEAVWRAVQLSEQYS